MNQKATIAIYQTNLKLSIRLKKTVKMTLALRWADLLLGNDVDTSTLYNHCLFALSLCIQALVTVCRIITDAGSKIILLNWKAKIKAQSPVKSLK